MGTIHAAPPAPAQNALPTGGQVVAGSATINSTTAANNAVMNVNQSSQRAVINWDAFNVGKNAAVNFNQPNANSVTLNRVTGATASMIEGAVKANGQVIFVNPNGVTFGRGADINAAGVVASTMNIADKDFMDGKSTYKGNGTGQVINEGKITTTNDGGYIALLAPEVRNDGYLLAKKGVGTVALGAGEQITLDFKGGSLISLKVDKSAYNTLIENKRVVEVNGGLVVIAAGSANQLMASVIRNTGKISANSLVSNGGVIELVANNLTQAGKISANSQSQEGGQINLVGSDITVAANSKTTATGATAGGQVNIGLANTQVSGGSQVSAPTQQAILANANQAEKNNQLATSVAIQENALIDTSATQVGNGGAIAIWSKVQTTVAGVLKSMGGALAGNGGFIETSSKGQVSIAPATQINTGANNSTGRVGTWLLDPVDLFINSSAATVISEALSNSNVTIAVTANTSACTLGICILNGTGLMVIDSGAHILKAGTNYTTLTLSAAGNFRLDGSITGQNLDVVIQSSIAYLGVGSSINASKVTIQAQTILSYGTVQTSNYYLFGSGAGTLGNAIELLAQSIFISGTLRLNAGVPLVPDLMPTILDLNLQNANQGLNKIYSSTAANDPSILTVTPVTQAASNVIYLTASQIDPASAAVVGLEGTAQVLASGTNGGSVYLRGTYAYTKANSLLQAIGTAGPGGMIGINADDIEIAGELNTGGSTHGGSINLIANAGVLNLQGRLIKANGGTGLSGVINAQVSGIPSLLANLAMVAGSPSDGIDFGSILFIRVAALSAAAGSPNLGYEIVDASGTIVNLGTGSYANLSISGTPSYFNNTAAIADTLGSGTYASLKVKGLTLGGVDSGHYMLVSIPAPLTISPAQSIAPPAPMALAPPPPPPPPPVMFSAPLPAPAPAKMEIAPALAPSPVPANSPPPAAGGEIPMQAPAKAAPLMVMSDGSIQLTPPPPPGAAPSAVNASAPQAPPAPPPAGNRASPNKESRDARNGNNNSETRKYGSTKGSVEKADAKDRSGKLTNGPSKYVSKYANGFRNGDKPAPKEGSSKTVAGTKPNSPPREGKYSSRINAMTNNPAVIAAMAKNPFAGNVLPFPQVAPNIVPAPVVLRGGDSLTQSYDDVPSIRNSGAVNVGRSRASENYHESLESVNLMSTLNLFIIR
ncbi:filamentous hemagglutinin N-terminal domain-containing protein [Polynucleobacter sp. 80A-SIGWE]|uniref:two-partner secretion domain-containing protein n=1 Tax=Polynucleobacter sp. 80A-SIGWE TaxID=2689100 RepID=UPI001C0E7EBE|nr:filamentous hemagglutinin N-terminal domain-containing protein [Polynucleobacter sp. 80A-SIGWE]